MIRVRYGHQGLMKLARRSWDINMHWDDEVGEGTNAFHRVGVIYLVGPEDVEGFRAQGDQLREADVPTQFSGPRMYDGCSPTSTSTTWQAVSMSPRRGMVTDPPPPSPWSRRRGSGAHPSSPIRRLCPFWSWPGAFVESPASGWHGAVS